MRAIEELRDKDIPELMDELKKHKNELFKLRFQLFTKQLKKTARIGEVKKIIARINTLITEKEKVKL